MWNLTTTSVTAATEADLEKLGNWQQELAQDPSQQMQTSQDHRQGEQTSGVEMLDEINDEDDNGRVEIVDNHTTYAAEAITAA